MVVCWSYSFLQARIVNIDTGFYNKKLNNCRKRGMYFLILEPYIMPAIDYSYNSFHDTYDTSINLKKKTYRKN